MALELPPQALEHNDTMGLLDGAELIQLAGLQWIL